MNVTQTTTPQEPTLINPNTQSAERFAPSLLRKIVIIAHAILFGIVLGFALGVAPPVFAVLGNIGVVGLPLGGGAAGGAGAILATSPLFVQEEPSEPAFQPVMLDYNDPSYKIASVDDDTSKIEVEVKIGKDSYEEVAKKREAILRKEAVKPMLAMAFIQKLAADGDTQGQQISLIYQAYHRFFADQDRSAFMKVCDSIANEKNGDPLAKNFAKYLLQIMQEEDLDPSLEPAKELLNCLIPRIEQTLTMQPLVRMYEEQRVEIAEMQAAKHIAFPDLIKYEGYYLACFREANSHVGYKDDGKVRILRGYFNDQTLSWRWLDIKLLKKDGFDLRDPRFFINSKNEPQIMVDASTISDKGTTAHLTPHVAEFADYKMGEWDLSEAIVDPDHLKDSPFGEWIWRVTWNPIDNCGYALSYTDTDLRIMKTKDGLHFEEIGKIIVPKVKLSEGTIRFKSDGTAVALIRGKGINGVIATSSKDSGYTEWSTTAIPQMLGGPNFVIMGDEQRYLAATRFYFLNEDNTMDEAMVVGWMDDRSITPMIRLKSQLDCSYPGLVLEEDGSVSILYYSSEPGGKSHLYITRLQAQENN